MAEHYPNHWLIANRCNSSDNTLVLNGAHICVGQAEMVADLVDDHMRHHLFERNAAAAAFIKQRAQEQSYHAGHVPCRPDRALTEGAAVVQTKQRPWVGLAHGVQHLAFGKILNAKDHVAQMIAEYRWKQLDGFVRQTLHGSRIWCVDDTGHGDHMGS